MAYKNTAFTINDKEIKQVSDSACYFSVKGANEIAFGWSNDKPSGSDAAQQPTVWHYLKAEKGGFERSVNLATPLWIKNTNGFTIVVKVSEEVT